MVGVDLRVNGKLVVNKFSGLVIGQNVHIGANAHLDCRGGVFLGDNTHISRNCTVFSANHNYEGDLVPYDDGIIGKPVIIEKGVWIGMNVNITPGVIIGEGAIIGMGTTVTRNVPSFSIVGGAKQREIGGRDQTAFIRKTNSGKVGGASGRPYTGKFVDQECVVFVVSTGRSGSMSIVDSYNAHPEVDGFHEPFYAFFRYYSTEYLIGSISEEKARSIVGKIWSLFKRSGSKVLLISDQKIVPFIHFFRELEPNAKWIWLNRDPGSFVHSAVSRGWFKNDEPIILDGKVVLQEKYFSDGARVSGPLVTNMPWHEWDEMSQIEKTLWYWEYWNRIIESKLSGVDKADFLYVPLNELNYLKLEIAKFIGVENNLELISSTKSNQVKKAHAKKYEAERSLRNVELDSLNRFKNAKELYQSWLASYGNL